MDGAPVDASSGVEFLDRMLHSFARHAGCRLTVRARGDALDRHRLIEDVGASLGDKRRIVRG